VSASVTQGGHKYSERVSGRGSGSVAGAVMSAAAVQVEVYVDAVTAALAVDGRRVDEGTDYGTARLLDVGSARLYVGGVGVPALAAAVDARLASLLGADRVVAGSLRGGCVRNFKVDLAFTSCIYLLIVLCGAGPRLGEALNDTRICAAEASATVTKRLVYCCHPCLSVC